MTQHSSLRGEGMGKRHRNVLKRYERVRKLKEGEKWEEGRSVFGLPKVKSIKVKVKKAKTVEKAEEAAAATAGEAAPGAPPVEDKGKKAEEKKSKPA